MKDHEIAAVVNDLTKVAQEFGQTQQLRERIVRVIVPILQKLAQAPNQRGLIDYDEGY